MGRIDGRAEIVPRTKAAGRRVGSRSAGSPNYAVKRMFVDRQSSVRKAHPFGVDCADRQLTIARRNCYPYGGAMN